MKKINNKNFYSQIVEVESIVVELDKLDLSNSEKLQLSSLADSNLHHTILDAILSELKDEDKKTFLRHLQNDDHNKIWDLLNSKVDNIEDKIKTAADQIKTELHKDIQESRKLK